MRFLDDIVLLGGKMNRSELGENGIIGKDNSMENDPVFEKQKQEIFEFFGLYNSLADAQKITQYPEMNKTDTRQKKLKEKNG